MKTLFLDVVVYLRLHRYHQLTYSTLEIFFKMPVLFQVSQAIFWSPSSWREEKVFWSRHTIVFVVVVVVVVQVTEFFAGPTRSNALGVGLYSVSLAVKYTFIILEIKSVLQFQAEHFSFLKNRSNKYLENSNGILREFFESSFMSQAFN